MLSGDAQSFGFSIGFRKNKSDIVLSLAKMGSNDTKISTGG